ncbi:DNA mismatch repair protein MLH3-like [Solanum dulcamara]|uniref:DNA mismatch repair protein MLH3-like n=1 Tax=Solanum dulcamara TaxID=45834 RepID=UPI0024869961|nr:DNA mismatch repair protein MLH3-like [Solanum dulcamara]
MKFIPIVANTTLAIIDQHAADERIRLEELREKVLSGQKRTITCLDSEQELLQNHLPATSKYRHSDDMHAFPASFGFKGEALSYISDVSLLESVTKTHWRPNEHRKVLKDSKCLYLGIDDCRQDVGTTVILYEPT